MMPDLTPMERMKAEVELETAKATASKATTEAAQLSAEAQQKQISALIPDLSKVTPNPLDVKGETPLFGPALAQRATTAAACRAAQRVSEEIQRVRKTPGASEETSRILVTSDPALANSDAIYLEVLDGLKDLIKAAEELLKAAKPEPTAPAPAPAADAAGGEGEPEGVTGETAQPAQAPRSILPIGSALPALQAVASAVPAALSLLTAHRTLSTSADTVDSFAAAAAAAGELIYGRVDYEVFHDDFRLLSTAGAVQDKVSSLADKRQELVALKITLEQAKSTDTAQLGALKSAVNTSEEAFAKAKGEQKREALRSAMTADFAKIAESETAVGKSAARLAPIESALSAIDAFTTSMRMTVAGATRSPLTTAILREKLHGGGSQSATLFTHVLLVKAEPGSVQQLVEDRPLWLKDTFTVIATSNVTYMLVKVEAGNVIRAGSIGGEAKIHGTIGQEFEPSMVEAKAMEGTT
jgi:hypothetical protein